MDREIRDFFEVGMSRDFSALMVVDKDYNIVRANIAAQKLLEKLTRGKKEDVVGMNITNIIPELKGNSRISDGVFEVSIDNRTYYLLPFRTDKDDSDDRIGVLMIDIYSHKEIESELAYQKEISKEFEEILEGSFDGILVTDAEGKILFVNSSYERVAEIKRSEMEGKYMRDLINPVWMPETVAHIVARERTVVSKRQVVKSGRHIMVTGRPIFDNKKNIKKIIINARDITEIYELTEELQKAKENEKLYINRFTHPLTGTDDSDQKILAASDAMKSVLSLAGKVANFHATVLILGESGVGKEEVAKFIHENSMRKGKPFVVVNCGAIPDNLLESELFGYEKGAFTGAMQTGKQGLFEAAEGGTIFLDEIGEMPLDFQVKLLRFLESKEVRRVGSVDAKIVDVRVIAATNRDLFEMVQEGTFREDLYYRLNVVQIDVPPLRKRIDDIMPLASLFLNRYNKKYGQEKMLTYDLIKALEKYSWQGNVRQLKNIMENMVIVSNNEYLQTEDLPWNEKEKKNEMTRTIGSLVENEELGLNEAVEELERRILLKAKDTCGTTRKIAEKLKVNQSTIVRKMQKYNLE
ncbi:MAG: sigma 54-interacting transcriptional regulator [Firmicutes bacterium]|nr:sigma 54-interacting transcriptional regulator [Bacillota bacterium]